MDDKRDVVGVGSERGNAVHVSSTEATCTSTSGKHQPSAEDGGALRIERLDVDRVPRGPRSSSWMERGTASSYASESRGTCNR